MTRNTSLRGIGVLLSIVGITPSSSNAHHSFVSHYDASKVLKITGVVADFRMRSPHSFLLVNVADENGAIRQWEVETHSVPSLRRAGIDQDTFKPGDNVTVIAWSNRQPDNPLVFGRAFITADGRTLGEAAELRTVSVAIGDTQGIERLNGRWMTPPPGRADTTPLPLTATARKYRDDFDPQLSPANACVPATIPSIFYAPYLFDIRINENTVTLRHEVFSITREIEFDAAPTRAERSGWFGRATASIDGDELVIKSSNYPPSGWGLAIAAGKNGAGRDIPSSPGKKTVERYSVSEDGRTLRLDYILEDSVYLTKPYSSFVELSRVADETPMHPFDCDIGSAARFSAEP